MHEYHLMSLTSAAIAERRAEADRHRLARSADAPHPPIVRPAGGTAGPRRAHRPTLRSLFGWIALS